MTAAGRRRSRAAGGGGGSARARHREPSTPRGDGSDQGAGPRDTHPGTRPPTLMCERFGVRGSSRHPHPGTRLPRIRSNSGCGGGSARPAPPPQGGPRKLPPRGRPGRLGLQKAALHPQPWLPGAHTSRGLGRPRAAQGGPRTKGRPGRLPGAAAAGPHLSLRPRSGMTRLAGAPARFPSFSRAKQWLLRMRCRDDFTIRPPGPKPRTSAPRVAACPQNGAAAAARLYRRRARPRPSRRTHDGTRGDRREVPRAAAPRTSPLAGPPEAAPTIGRGALSSAPRPGGAAPRPPLGGTRVGAGRL